MYFFLVLRLLKFPHEFLFWSFGHQGGGGKGRAIKEKKKKKKIRLLLSSRGWDRTGQVDLKQKLRP